MIGKKFSLFLITALIFSISAGTTAFAQSEDDTMAEFYVIAQAEGDPADGFNVIAQTEDGAEAELDDIAQKAAEEAQENIPPPPDNRAQEEEVLPQPLDEDSVVPEKTPKKKKPLVYPYRRFIEFGVDVGAGFANNFLSVGEALQKNLVIDMAQIGDTITDDGMNINLELAAKVFFNVNLTDLWGFGVYTSVSGSINGNLPKSLIELASKGNLLQHSSSGEISAFGGIFADINIDAHARILEKKLKISVIPSMFMPLVYIPKSGFRYSIQADGTLKVTGGGQLDIYSPISLKNLSSFSISEINSIFDAKGFDLSLNGEYRLFDFLDVGGTISHIPLVPAYLNNRMSVTAANTTIVDEGNVFDTISEKGQDFSIEDLIHIPTEWLKTGYSTNGISVMRPLRFDIYADYKPFKTTLVVIRPTIGFTALTPEETARFNATLKAELNTPFFLLRLGTGYDELLWRHNLMLGLNLRVFELDIGLDLRSQDFVKSFMLNGAGVFVGVRFGF